MDYPPKQDFPDVICPVCGQFDVVLHSIEMTGNYYKCKSTNTLLILRIETKLVFEIEKYKKITEPPTP